MKSEKNYGFWAVLGALFLLGTSYLLLSRPSFQDEKYYYSVMLDAGSTGSRLHVYKFHISPETGNLVLDSEVFKTTAPGLSAYKTNPREAARSLEPLLRDAIEAVPERLRKKTPVNLKATAGLRMLGKDQADNILFEVRKSLQATPFFYDPSDAVGIMDGSDEGLFGWVAINYLKNTIHLDRAKTAAILDLGGGSTQVAASVSSHQFPPIDVLGSKHNMYIFSHLGYGLMAGRSGVLTWNLPKGDPKRAGQGKIIHPCIHRQTTVKYVYGDDVMVATGDENSNFEHCMWAAEQFIENPKGSFEETKDHPQIEKGQPIFAMSYYFDRAVETHLIKPDALQAELRVFDYMATARSVCGMDASAVSKSYPKVKTDDAPFLCMDLCFITSLLRHGFKLEPETTVTLAKKLLYNGEWVESQWTLGAAIREVSEQLDYGR